MYKPALLAGIVSAALAVITGAFGAHRLKELVTPDLLGVYEKAVTYQFYHSFALLAAGILFSAFPYGAVRTAAWLFLAGIICFSGSLYAIVGIKHNGGSPGFIGPVTPLGGLLFIAGWVSLLLGVLKKA